MTQKGNITVDSFDHNHEDFKTAFTFASSNVMLAFCFMGIFGNVMSAMIFTRRSMKSSINVLLTGLSFVDLLVLLLAIPLFAIPGLNAYGHFGTLPRLEMANIFVFYPIAVTAQTCSIWEFVLITCERYLAVCHPLKVQRVFTMRRAKLIQLIMIFLSILYNLCRFWEYAVIYDGRGRPLGFKRSLRSDWTYFLAYYTIAYLFVHFLIPFTVIAFLNFRISCTICTSSDFRSRSSSNQMNGGKFKYQTTRMIIIVTVIFSVCNLLPFTLNIWEAIYPRSFIFDSAWHSFLAYLLLEVSNVLVVFNSSVNFLVYWIYCNKYRRLFGSHVRRCWSIVVKKRPSVIRLRQSIQNRYSNTQAGKNRRIIGSIVSLLTNTTTV